MFNMELSVGRKCGKPWRKVMKIVWEGMHMFGVTAEGAKDLKEEVDNPWQQLKEAAGRMCVCVCVQVIPILLFTTTYEPHHTKV